MYAFDKCSVSEAAIVLKLGKALDAFSGVAELTKICGSVVGAIITLFVKEGSDSAVDVLLGCMPFGPREPDGVGPLASNKVGKSVP